MLPNSETCPNNRGFTLTELLVAMAIFVTLMGSLITLFSGTVDTTRAGYTRLATFEQGRTIVEVMKRDLSTAFTARDYGDVQQFYGQENGFSLIGANEFGQLSRISYAVVRVDDRHDFTAGYAEQLGVLVRRAISQGAKYGAATNPTLFPNALTGLILAQNLVSALASNGNLTDTAALAAYNELALIRDAVAANALVLADGRPLPDLSAPFLGIGLDDLFVEIEAVCQMAHLLRFEENAHTDLEGFKLPGDHNNRGFFISGWPKVDPADPAMDLFDPDVEGTNSNYKLYQAEVRAINPTLTADLRDFMYAYSYITPETIETILRANRRKIWIDFLTLSPPGNPNYPSFWRIPEAPGQAPVDYPANPDPRLNPLDFAVAEHFLLRTILRGSDTTTYPDIGTGLQIPLRDATGNPVDLYGNPAFFSYAQGSVNSDGHFIETFNANLNITAYKNMLVAINTNPANAEAILTDFDRLLLEAHTGYKSAVALQGSPLAPRIPSLIKVQFWAAKRGVRAGAPPVQRWFTEVVDVPAGMTRRAPTTIAAAGG